MDTHVHQAESKHNTIVLERLFVPAFKSMTFIDVVILSLAS